jgi:hypothetical protein
VLTITNNKFSDKPAIASQSRVFCLKKNRLNAVKDRKKNMNAKYRTLTANFAPEAKFEVRPAPATFRATQETELERLKNRLLRETLNELTNADANGFVRRAANEAAALAWDTQFPLLAFPTLFEEKARAAVVQIRRQASVRRRSLELLPL